MKAPTKTAANRTDMRASQRAPWIVRYERFVCYLWCAAAVVLLIAVVPSAIHAAPRQASAARYLVPLFVGLLALNWWLAGALRRGARAAWYVHLLIALLGAETVIQRLVQRQPFILADVPLCVEAALLVWWVRPDGRAWFGIGTKASARVEDSNG